MNKLRSLCLIAFTGLTLSTQAANNNSLEKYFDKNQINVIEEYKTNFNKIKTSKDLAASYKKANDLMKTMGETLNKSKEVESGNFDLAKFKWLDDYLPGIELSYSAEGMGINVIPNYQDFMKKAKITPQISDNTFLNLMTDIFGNSGDVYPKWFVMTWDYGGYTLLGKGTHKQLIQKINSVTKSSPEFANEIKEIRLRLFDDIINSFNLGFPKATVIKEVKGIMQLPNISASEKKMLQQKINDLEKNSKKYQFNCEKANCAYG